MTPAHDIDLRRLAEDRLTGASLDLLRELFPTASWSGRDSGTWTRGSDPGLQEPRHCRCVRCVRCVHAARVMHAQRRRQREPGIPLE
jgi:hypothetical protein